MKRAKKTTTTTTTRIAREWSQQTERGKTRWKLYGWHLLRCRCIGTCHPSSRQSGRGYVVGGGLRKGRIPPGGDPPQVPEPSATTIRRTFRSDDDPGVVLHA